MSELIEVVHVKKLNSTFKVLFKNINFVIMAKKSDSNKYCPP